MYTHRKDEKSIHDDLSRTARKYIYTIEAKKGHSE